MQRVSYLSSRAASVGRINQEVVEQVDGLRGRVRDDLLQWDRWILLEGDFIVIWQLHNLLKERKMFTYTKYFCVLTYKCT